MPQCELCDELFSYSSHLNLSSSQLDVGVIADASPSLRMTVHVDMTTYVLYSVQYSSVKLRLFVTSQVQASSDHKL
jgi:hypothetical protein